jgi:hypothetical protein
MKKRSDRTAKQLILNVIENLRRVYQYEIRHQLYKIDYGTEEDWYLPEMKIN